MPNEPVVDPPVVDPPVADPPVADPPAPDSGQVVTPPPSGNEELTVLKERLARYEQLVVSPEYAEFLAAKSRQVTPPTPAPQAPRQYSAEEKQAFQEKLNNMSRAEFAAFVRDLTVDVVRDQLFTPVVQSIVSDKVQNQIAEAAAEFKDFWDYKQDMIALSNANPALSAKQVYHLAKASRGTAPAAQGKPPLRKPTGEAPNVPPAGPKEAPPDNFKAAFDVAFQKSGL